jgi:type I site-specific restriction endonuclease
MWRKTLDHFDAVKIGLTATPAKHTTAYFKDVVFRYEYERAVREGYLVDYDVVTIKSNVRLNGVFLKEGEEVGVVDTESGAETRDVLEDERTFDTTSLEQTPLNGQSYGRPVYRKLRSRPGWTSLPCRARCPASDQRSRPRQPC